MKPLNKKKQAEIHLDSGIENNRAEKKALIAKAVEIHIASALKAMELDLKADGLWDTPRRVAKMFVYETCRGLYEPMPKMTVFENANPKCDEMVILKGAEIKSLCSHHCVPYIGRAFIGYIPDKKILGLSKLARLADWCARRPSVQEQLTQDIAERLYAVLKPKGLGVVVEATHFCMVARGVEQEGLCVTSAMRGNFKNNVATRKEFFDIINNGRRDGTR